MKLYHCLLLTVHCLLIYRLGFGLVVFRLEAGLEAGLEGGLLPPVPVVPPAVPPSPDTAAADGWLCSFTGSGVGLRKRILINSTTTEKAIAK
jgi:hypothetical protein